jgi:hypothetical protein
LKAEDFRKYFLFPHGFLMAEMIAAVLLLVTLFAQQVVVTGCHPRRLKERRAGMKRNCSKRWVWSCLAVGALIFATARSQAGSPRAPSCPQIVLAGEVSGGQEWKAAFGEGWIFRVLPIQPGNAGYSGWDLVVDREQAAGFPDALLVATPPYDSINEREVGTTFGLRAQDAIGWNPRSFRFLTSPDAFRESQKLYFSLSQGGRGKLSAAGQGTSEAVATRRLMEIERQSSAGEFRILDAHLVPGVSDAAPYAESWALASPRTPHSLEPAAQGKSTPLGEFRWMRFSITLWLPAGWASPPALHAARVACRE